MQFTKLQGTGNDYIFVDAIAEPQRDWPQVARKVSDRHFGIGADGLIIATESSIADVRMRMFNADGSEGEMCGNGIRCFAKFVLDKQLINSDQTNVEVETGAGVLKIIPHREGSIINGARVDMGQPTLKAPSIPIDQSKMGPSDFSQLDREELALLDVKLSELVFDSLISVEGVDLLLTGISMGNPHVVAFLNDDVYQFDLNKIGHLIENHPAFPNRINFHIVNIVNSRRIVTRTWERGSGITLACGTGASAMVVAGKLHGFLEEEVKVGVPGGSLIISWQDSGSVFMDGDAVEVFSGQISI